MIAVERTQISDEVYRVSVLDDEFTQESFHKVLSQEERLNWIVPDGFTDAAPLRFPEHHGFFAYIRGHVPETK